MAKAANTQAIKLNIANEKDEVGKFVRPPKSVEINVSDIKLGEWIDKNKPDEVAPIIKGNNQGRANTEGTPEAAPTSTDRKPITVGQLLEDNLSVQDLEEKERRETLTPEEAKAVATAKKIKGFDQGDAVEMDDEAQPLDTNTKSKDKLFEEGDIIKYMFENWFVKPIDGFINEWILEPIIWAGACCYDEWDTWRQEKQNTLSGDNSNSPEAKFAIRLGDYMQSQREILMNRNGAGPKEIKSGIKELTSAVEAISQAQTPEEAKKVIEDTLQKFSNITDPKAQEILAAAISPDSDKDDIKAAIQKSYQMQRLADLETKLKNNEDIPPEWLSPSAAKSLKAVYGNLTDEQKANPDLVRGGISKTLNLDLATFEILMNATQAKVIGLHERGAYDNLDLDKLPIHKLVAIEAEEIGDALYKWIEKKPSVIDDPKGLFKAAQLAKEGRDKIMKDVKDGNRTTGYDPNAPFYEKVGKEYSLNDLDKEAEAYREHLAYDKDEQGVKSPVNLRKATKESKSLLEKWQRHNTPNGAPINPVFTPEKEGPTQ